MKPLLQSNTQTVLHFSHHDLDTKSFELVSAPYLLHVLFSRKVQAGSQKAIWGFILVANLFMPYQLP